MRNENADAESQLSEDSEGQYEDQEQNGDDKRAKLPSIRDPKLWQVRVKKGSERLAAMALMNKIIDFASKGKPFSILSATYAENIENFIFVEAYKIESVREAIDGLSFCYMKINIVPLNEMTKIYED